MNDSYIVTTYVVIDDILKAHGFADDCRATGTAAEILTVGVIAAKYFQNHHERALGILSRLGYVHGLSVSRFNRWLHALREWLIGIISLVADLYAQGEAFIIDSMPLPVCKRARATRCKKVRGKAFCGYCAAKKEKFFGWRLHLICTPHGIPVSFDVLPASEQDLTPIHELTAGLPEGTTLLLTPYRAPNANAFAERWVRTVRGECLNHLLIVNDTHLRRVLKEYIDYYNHARPHQGLNQHIPVQPAVISSGEVRCRHVLGGLIHDYYRAA